MAKSKKNGWVFARTGRRGIAAYAVLASFGALLFLEASPALASAESCPSWLQADQLCSIHRVYRQLRQRADEKRRDPRDFEEFALAEYSGERIALAGPEQGLQGASATARAFAGGGRELRHAADAYFEAGKRGDLPGPETIATAAQLILPSAVQSVRLTPGTDQRRNEFNLFLSQVYDSGVSAPWLQKLAELVSSLASEWKSVDPEEISAKNVLAYVSEALGLPTPIFEHSPALTLLTGDALKQAWRRANHLMSICQAPGGTCLPMSRPSKSALIVAEALKDQVHELSQDYEVYHWLPVNPNFTASSASPASENPGLLDFLRVRIRQGVGPALWGSMGVAGDGLYAALDPSSTITFGGKDPAVIRIRLRKGFRYFTLFEGFDAEKYFMVSQVLSPRTMDLGELAFTVNREHPGFALQLEQDFPQCKINPGYWLEENRGWLNWGKNTIELMGKVKNIKKVFPDGPSFKKITYECRSLYAEVLDILKVDGVFYTYPRSSCRDPKGGAAWESLGGIESSALLIQDFKNLDFKNVQYYSKQELKRQIADQPGGKVRGVLCGRASLLRGCGERADGGWKSSFPPLSVADFEASLDYERQYHIGCGTLETPLASKRK